METKSIKILVAGENGVGGTTLLYKFINGTFIADTSMTPGGQIHVTSIQIDEDQYDLIFWDICSPDRFRWILPRLVTGASGAILLYDTTQMSTLGSFEEWVGICRTQDKNLPILVCGTKIDLVGARSVAGDYAKGFLQPLELFDYIELSAKTGENVENAIETLVRRILGKPFPETEGVTIFKQKQEVEKKRLEEKLQAEKLVEEEKRRIETKKKDDVARKDTQALAAYNARFGTPTSVTIPSTIQVVFENLANKLDIILRMSALSWTMVKITHPNPETLIVYDAAGEIKLEVTFQNPDCPRYLEYRYTDSIFTGDPQRKEQFLLKFQLNEQGQDTTEVLVTELCLNWNATRYETWQQFKGAPTASLKTHLVPALFLWGQTLPKKETADRDRDLKVVLGMIKSRKQIQLTRAAEKLGIARVRLEELIFELLGGNVVEGEFLDDDTFQITSDVGAVIKALEASFASWKQGPGEKV